MARMPKGTPIVNDAHYTDARPTIGSPSATFNPGGAQQAGPLPNGPPRFIQPKGRRFQTKGNTNKRIPSY